LKFGGLYLRKRFSEKLHNASQLIFWLAIEWRIIDT